MDVLGELSRSGLTITEIKLQGPRPAALTVNKCLAGIKKPVAQRRNQSDPVVVYLRSPKVIHVQPEEFMKMVQLLTGNNPASSAGSSDSLAASRPTSSDDSGRSSQGLCTNS
ncbi:hypothetical protein CRG98_036746 [Punica granatum]|uniref:VQ domain-containing protein n=1 Tax=Punica granatum TaxID=22663 RepID=A0A2I0IG48_PUNGR|nr:hypothetical protein CRG98_036746 [Punica granatum]